MVLSQVDFVVMRQGLRTMKNKWSMNKAKNQRVKPEIYSEFC